MYMYNVRVGLCTFMCVYMHTTDLYCSVYCIVSGVPSTISQMHIVSSLILVPITQFESWLAKNKAMNNA